MLEQYEPSRVLYYFEEICKIPHGSGNTRAISDYLKNFAKEQGLYCRQDEMNNIVMIKEASKGYEDHAPVMLQGHMDMVTVKTPECPLDLTKDGLQLFVENDCIRARGTSLGGDDGVAIAFALAILESSTIAHPRLELVVTVDEEVGMNGATFLDLADTTAVRLINLDQEEEGIFVVSCAGGIRTDLRMKPIWEKKSGVCYQLTVNGLLGGHSGVEIHKGRGNAICIMGRVLAALQSHYTLAITQLHAGVADNVIPQSAEAEFLIKEQDEEGIRALVSGILADVRKELADRDPDIQITVSGKDTVEKMALTDEITGKIIGLLHALPHGVVQVGKASPTFIETSLNPGIVTMNEGEIDVVLSVRSTIDSAKTALVEQLNSIAKLAGASISCSGDYPGWSCRAESELRDKMVQIYEDMFGHKPVVEAIHAGLECGILIHKRPELDSISIGPQIDHIHSVNEALHISSMQRTWRYLLQVLSEL